MTSKNPENNSGKSSEEDSLGRRRGQGRPKGSRNIYSNESVKKLEQLGFDPISMMVEKYYQVEEMINDGTIRKGSGAHAQLLATQQKIINDLMQYGYRRVPEKQELSIENKKPIAIKLTSPKKDEADDKKDG
jgi:hypothetical protein